MYYKKVIKYKMVYKILNTTFKKCDGYTLLQCKLSFDINNDWSKINIKIFTNQEMKLYQKMPYGGMSILAGHYNKSMIHTNYKIISDRNILYRYNVNHIYPNKNNILNLEYYFNNNPNNFVIYITYKKQQKYVLNYDAKKRIFYRPKLNVI